MFGNLHRGAKLAALVATGVVTLGGVAAATGALPGPAQGAAHDALGAAGIQVPDDGSAGDGSVVTNGAPDTTTTTVDPTTTSTSEPAEGDAPASADPTDTRGPDPNGPAKHGLCTASAAGQGGEHGKKSSSTAFRALAAAASAKGQTVEEFCADATPGGKAAPDTKSTITTATTEVAQVETTGPAPTPTAPTSGPGHSSSHGNPHGGAANHGASGAAHGA